MPAEGHCYRALHPRGRGAPEVDCMRPCADPLACPGGAAGEVCAEEGAELPGYDEREARARGFAASEQRGRETGDVSWNCANATCSCLEFRPPYT